MASYDRLHDDFLNLASILQDFNSRLEKLEASVAKLAAMPPPVIKDEPVLPGGSMTVQSFLRATGMSRSSFYAYAKDGLIDVRKFGRRNYILTSELERWLHDLKRRS